jgi:redox-sensitive bicupin YhaK (pirin superfamily)
VTHKPSDNFDVRPHPHIGLATVTYLFAGAMLHRDSLGSVQRIEPGAINWMTSGKGITHSERGPEDLHDTPYPLHGLQLWAALPLEQEECEPAFAHTPAAVIPVHKGNLFSARVLIGSAFALTSPVATFSETLYIDIETQPGAAITLPSRAGQYALYSVDGNVEIGGENTEPAQMAVLDLSAPLIIKTKTAARFVIIGGEPLDAYRHMWWNFVSSRKERIEQAKDDWRAQRLGHVAGETEFIPLPEH